MTARVLLEMPEEMLRALDEVRGRVPRNAWIREAIDLHLSDTVRPVVRAPEPTPSKPLPYVPVSRAAMEAKPKKEQPVKETKGCQHLHTKTKFGRHICLDCGEWAS